MKHDIQPSGIAYINRYYNLRCIKLEELPYASILTLLLGKLGTDKHTSEEIDTLLRMKLGYFSPSLAFFENIIYANDVSPCFCIRTSALCEYDIYLASLIDEILFHTEFSDFNKIKKILQQKKVEMEQSFIMAGHIAAMNTALSGIMLSYYYNSLVNGVQFYEFLKQLINNFDNKKEELATILKDVAYRIFRATSTLSVSGTGAYCEIDSEIDKKMITENINN